MATVTIQRAADRCSRIRPSARLLDFGTRGTRALWRASCVEFAPSALLRGSPSPLPQVYTHDPACQTSRIRRRSDLGTFCAAARGFGSCPDRDVMYSFARASRLLQTSCAKLVRQVQRDLRDDGIVRTAPIRGVHLPQGVGANPARSKIIWPTSMLSGKAGSDLISFAPFVSVATPSGRDGTLGAGMLPARYQQCHL